MESKDVHNSDKTVNSDNKDVPSLVETTIENSTPEDSTVFSDAVQNIANSAEHSSFEVIVPNLTINDNIVKTTTTNDIVNTNRDDIVISTSIVSASAEVSCSEKENSNNKWRKDNLNEKIN